MNALIIGDSQTWGIGGALKGLLEAQGFTVTMERHSGWGTKKLLGLAANLTDRASYQRVYIQTGGNDYVAEPASLVELIKLFPSAAVTVISLPPATSITNLKIAKKAFGAKVKTAEHWFQSSFAAKREQKNAAYKAASKGVAAYVDVRTLGIPGHVQPTGVIFPNQPDGIHVKGDTAAQVASKTLEYSEGANLFWFGAALVGFILFTRIK